MTEISEFFPFWALLSNEIKQNIEENAKKRSIKKGTMILNSSDECLGLMLIREGQIRAYIISEDGKEVTLYRLKDGDICLFSASCIMNSISFDISLEAEKDTSLFIIPSDVYKNAMDTSLDFANFTNAIMQERFSSIMLLLDQILFKRMDSRIASFLVDEAEEEKTNVLSITQEKIAKHLGTAREVVTRLLKYFQEMDAIRISRGKIEITDITKLMEYSKGQN